MLKIKIGNIHEEDAIANLYLMKLTFLKPISKCSLTNHQFDKAADVLIILIWCYNRYRIDRLRHNTLFNFSYILSITFFLFLDFAKGLILASSFQYLFIIVF